MGRRGGKGGQGGGRRGRRGRKRRSGGASPGGAGQPENPTSPEADTTPEPAAADRTRTGEPDTGPQAPAPAAGATPGQRGAAGTSGADTAGASSGPMSMREAVARLHTRASGRDPDATTEAPPEPTPVLVRRFSVDGDDWLARQAGVGSGGTGEVGLARLVAVRFYRPEQPERARREALLPTGRLENMYDDELRDLFRQAQPIESSD